jgi:hypothetical protein
MIAAMMSCPHCHIPLDFRIGLTSGLGAPVGPCGSCRRPVATGRNEWPAMTALGRMRYVLLSALYVVVVPWLGAGVAYDLWTRLGQLTERYSAQVFYSGAFLREPFARGLAVALAVVTLALQVYRVRASIRRSAAPTPPRTIGLQRLDFGLQVKMLLVLCLVWLGLCAAQRYGGAEPTRSTASQRHGVS